MAVVLSPPRHLSIAFALVAILIAGQVRAEDTPAPAAAMGQKAGQGPRGAATPPPVLSRPDDRRAAPRGQSESQPIREELRAASVMGHRVGMR